MRVRPFSLVVLAVFLLAVSVAPVWADTAPVLDQNHPWPAHSLGSRTLYDGWAYGQTYTAGIAGTLAGITFNGYSLQSAYPLQVSIYSVVGGVPGSELGAVVLPLGQPPFGVNNFYVDFLSLGIPQVAGMQYAIVLSYLGATPAGAVGYFTTGLAGHNPYGAGTLFLRTGPGSPWTNIGYNFEDLHFQTYVQPIPEPSTLLLVGSGLAGLLWRRRKS